MANGKMSMRFGKRALTAVFATLVAWVSGCGLQPTKATP